MAALSTADGATFSFGSFSWWIAFLSNGPVLYDAKLADAKKLRETSCDFWLSRANHGAAEAVNISNFAAAHFPTAWRPIENLPIQTSR
ncbi:hypothetical protein M885DRAFT_522090 [Pelagophyceae sp. CCMP2097]|nr:hypothetical protein M885DRAFT_522090 [Pelagophyceae sp. CCMP2097]|mmetsp:Transcript_886/g.3141  ORF Transcript_886/g.3141 Transcript_886/m.3141 type:complete len:88 (+) Transcript_886:3-266(+)